MTAPSLERPLVPALDAGVALQLLREHFGVDGGLSPLPSERDQNFRVTTADGTRYVLKLALPDEDAAFAMQAALLHHVAAVDPDLPLPRMRPARDGRDVVAVSVQGRAYRMRLVSWMDGVPLAEVPRSPGQLRALGRAAGRLARAGPDRLGRQRPVEAGRDPALDVRLDLELLGGLELTVGEGADQVDVVAAGAHATPRFLAR